MTAVTARDFSIRRLARLYGVQTAYYDVSGRRREATHESLLQAVRALGGPVETLRDVPGAIRERRQALWRRGVEPIVVAWDGRPAEVRLSLPEESASGSVSCEVVLEEGGAEKWNVDIADLFAAGAEDVEGVRYVSKNVAVPPLPSGHHRLALELKGRRYESTVISAPTRGYAAPHGADRLWGVFLPLYALHSDRSWGGGDLSDFEELMDWAAGLGGKVAATLPFLASFLDEPFNPSPYAPVSRLFWNEFYVDVSRVPELAGCPAARSLLAQDELQAQVEDLRSSDLVDYRRQMALKRRVLEEMARCFFAGESGRQAALEDFVASCPGVEDYARFRATCEREGVSWLAWPERLRDGALRPGDYDERVARYHLYAQFVAHEQLRQASDRADRNGQLMYLDLPLGVHPYGYDVWRYRDVFATDVSAGAPPDAVFTRGQDWGFPPLHPERLREQGYEYVVAYLRHHLRQAGILRVDHVMGLHRLFWIPKGLDAGEGVYVRYPSEELYAILSVESHRHRTLIVGENLGTVPSYVNPAMSRHCIHSMYVVHYELATNAGKSIRAVPRDSVASLNTHDMPPFAAFWTDLDIDERCRLGLLTDAAARKERKTRRGEKNALTRFLQRKGLVPRASGDAGPVCRAILRLLGASSARLLLVNLEDLWLETRPQNVPGTWREYPNWQRKARHSLEEFRQMPQVVETLREVDRLRNRGESRR